ncbi:hypothetical protein LMH87_012242 [Akanthomyces muscarius]|uniref:Uncharacterized protein n=1 Tax=Akanthomyces muscarius TaxID=2231603 RepID=A0A9W8ULY7_AKAMU|nr:hypothetical protein LMH87_012242 [Akanthomyces muscarius]KAJ4151550.1 hypothetical protein LMH87_012242 [Akanthomyces muscarius]
MPLPFGKRVAAVAAADTPASSQACAAYDLESTRVCFEYGKDTWARPSTTAGDAGAKITQTSDAQVQVLTNVPVVAGAGKAIPGMVATGAAVAVFL